MKGVVFATFLDLIESEFGLSTVDAMLEKAETSTQGVFTSAGTYPSSDMTKMVDVLSELTKAPKGDLYRHFGKHLFFVLKGGYPIFFEKATGALDFMATINNYIHVEVRKLYPDADLPYFDIEAHTEDRLIMVYRSHRCMSDLALGLTEGCLESFGEEAEIHRTFLEQDGSVVRFDIQKTNSVHGRAKLVAEETRS